MNRIRAMFIWYHFQDFLDNRVEFISDEFYEMCEASSYKSKNKSITFNLEKWRGYKLTYHDSGNTVFIFHVTIFPTYAENHGTKI